MAFNEELKKLDERLDNWLREEPLTTEEIEELWRNLAAYFGLAEESRLRRKFIAHGLVEERLITTSLRIRAETEWKTVLPPTLAGYKIVLTARGSIEPLGLSIDLLANIKRNPLVTHLRALAEALDWRIVLADKGMQKAWKSGEIFRWAIRNQIAVVRRRSTDFSFWVDADDIPLFRLTWEGRSTK